MKAPSSEPAPADPPALRIVETPAPTPLAGDLSAATTDAWANFFDAIFSAYEVVMQRRAAKQKQASALAQATNEQTA